MNKDDKSFDLIEKNKLIMIMISKIMINIKREKHAMKL